MAGEPHVIALSFSESKSIDGDTGFRLERVHLADVDRRRAVYRDEGNRVVVYSDQLVALDNDVLSEAEVAMKFSFLVANRQQSKRWQCIRRIYVWYSDSADYDTYKKRAVEMFNNIFDTMPADSTNYVMKVLGHVERNVIIRKLVSIGHLTHCTDDVDSTVSSQKTSEIKRSKVSVKISQEKASLYESIIPDSIKKIADPKKTNNSQEIRQRFRSTIIWVAKKQCILEVLEQAFPNALNMDQLLRRCNSIEKDKFVVVIILKELENKGLIKTVAGKYMRVPKGKGHVVKFVKQFPTLPKEEQPTIGVVTALYCEKLAVDAMLGQKISYVKYKGEGNEGDNHVYTLGTIGQHKVVVTKLAQIGTEGGAATSAENTITRLLGTFSLLKHVFIVGVCGAVPGTTTVRLGDVIVSTSGEAYVSCDRADKDETTGKYVPSTRVWSPKDSTLSKLALSLKKAKEEGNKSKKWRRNLEQGQKAVSQGEVNFLNFGKPGTGDKKPKVHFGAFGSGKAVMADDNLRVELAKSRNIVGFDHHFSAVFSSMEGSRHDSWLIIRGVADNVDGWQQCRWHFGAKWQPFASLTAAAYLKGLIMALK
ncbi:uncharacterized protein LOC106159868 [Lingula anatina]|uniref:Uncharacterized protein LOC106159868 n=1 Tax=Lingula anatina TaxID=7574 RepID=A0A1S3I327_LINAN|nr:uncharacterized protein LOC106159868 [Lingula anatina]|eukprot:XP_013391754.1 uncharacterized protein LOC106159868 [Lingula anatina]